SLWLCLAVLLLLLLDLLLPASLFDKELWRERLGQAGVLLNGTYAVQPITALKQAAVLAACAGWAIWILSHCWSRREKTWLATLFVVLASSTAAYALGVYWFRWPQPAWIPVQGFGPFPNRNQSGTFFGLTLALAVALAGRTLQKRRWGLFLVWAILVGFDLLALVRADSRAGVLIWGLVILLWFLFTAPRWRMASSLAIAGAAALVIAGVLLLARSAVLERVAQTLGDGFGFRPLVYADTARMIAGSPAFGTGVGSFAAVFPQFQTASITTYAVIHPESDWLWFAAEAGIPAAFLLLLLTIIWLKRAIAGIQGTSVERMAAFATLGFWLNSWVDVPGHRMGTLFAGVLCLAIAVRSTSANRRSSNQKRSGKPRTDSNEHEFNGPIRVYSRPIAVGVALTGIYSLGIGGLLVLVSDPIFKVERLTETQDYHSAAVAATRALRNTPLSWQLYLLRGEGQAHLGRWVAALQDFRCASLLQPFNPDVSFFQGAVWSSLNPVLADVAWNEALRRQPVQRRAELLWRMIDSVPEAQRPAIGFDRLAGRDPRLLAVLQGYALLDKKGDEELRSHLTDLDTNLRPVVAGRLAAEAAASHDFDQACRLIQSYLAPKALPQPLNASESDLRTRMERDPSDFLTAFSLVRLLGSEQRWSDAAASVQSTVQLAACPRYLRFLCGQALVKDGRPEDAWHIFEPLISP
ncbi:MAG: O-antigen ligase family protein, partial [Verrucomicrobia bacterium]|nr:O-antigen ligase family protein [Verrucomicrobiota bacterium]